MISKNVFTIVALIISVISFSSYYSEIWKKKAEPHLLTWLTWTILTGLGFILSFKDGGGAGSYIFAFSSIMSLVIVIYAAILPKKNITLSDKMIFITAMLVAIFYTFTKNALLSIILAVTIDCLGYIPTFRKSYSQPFHEPILIYFLGTISYTFSILALQTFSVVTMLYPTTLIVINSSLVLFLTVRRKIVNKNRLEK